MEKLFQVLLTRFFGLFRVFEADPEQLQAIVLIKLKTDNRRQHVAFQNSRVREPSRAFLMTVFVYSIVGTLIGYLVYAVPSVMLSMVVFFSFLITMVAMSLITDFSTILLDTSDNTIILPRPVSGRTLHLARTIHILLYLGQITIGLCIPSIVAVIFRFGMMSLIPFLLLIVASVFISLLVTNGIYLAILNFSSERQLRTVINYFQIVMGILLMAGYQIIPRYAVQFQNESVFEIRWWYWFFPPVWLASTMESIDKNIINIQSISIFVLTLLIPMTGLVLVTRYLTPLFNRKLGALVVEKKVSDKKNRRNSWIYRLAGWINKTSAERASFVLVYKLLGRDPKIKLKIYPVVGYMLIFGFIVFVRGGTDLVSLFNDPSRLKFHVILFYLPFLIVQVACQEIPYSDDFKASWVYFAAPFSSPGEVLSGMVKAIMFKFLLPLYIGVSAIILFFGGLSKIDDVVFGLINNYIMVMTFVSIQSHRLPFSSAPDVKGQGGNFIRALWFGGITTVIGIGHYLVATKPTLMAMTIPVQLLIAFLLHRAYRKIKWRDITL